MTTRRWFAAGGVIAAVLFASSASIAPAKNVPTTPSIDGAVYTTVDGNDPNSATYCHNGNPGVNCNQYNAKTSVYLNGGPAKNSLSPAGYYFYAVLAPGGQPNPNDGAPGNLSSPYDCYKNRLIQIGSSGEVVGTVSEPASDTACFPTPPTPFAAGTPHKYDAPFVQLWPYVDTPNPGGVYIMAVCWVGTTPTAALPAGGVNPSMCKYDAFKVDFDSAAPVCKLVSRTLSSDGKTVTAITVAVQDAGAGLEGVDYTTYNAVGSFPSPLVVGQTDPWYLTATKTNLAQGATLAITAYDTAGNQVKCDPAYGLPHQTESRIVSAGHRASISGLSSQRATLSLTRLAVGASRVTVSVNGRRFAIVAMGRQRTARLELGAGLLRRSGNVVTVSLSGRKGKILVRISN